MSGVNLDKNRNVIPRWRTFEATLQYRELDFSSPFQKHQKITHDFLLSKIAGWRKHRTIAYAADVVGAALTLGRENEVTDAVNFLLQNDLNLSSLVRELANEALRRHQRPASQIVHPEEITKEKLRAQVKTFRDLLHIEPRDPITWVELSRVYATLGIGEHAAKCMTVAYQLACDNRFVLRSASRLWIHLDDAGRAHDVISRSARTKHDPWLLAAEIATSNAAGKTPRFVKSARRVLSDGKFPPVYVSELASAVATLELNAGNIKKSKKIFKQSLGDPTENSIAQAVWAAKEHRWPKLVEVRHLSRPNTFEACALNYYENEKWQDVVKNANHWQFDQPFSSWPGTLGSYVAAVALEDYSMSQSFAEQGLIANPTDFTLLNNLAFAKINSGDIAEAEETLKKIKRSKISDINAVILQSTHGFMEFRKGNPNLGRKLYSCAFGKARRLKNEEVLALASAFYALEELKLKSSEANAAISIAIGELQKIKDPIRYLLQEKLMVASKKNRSAN